MNTDKHSEVTELLEVMETQDWIEVAAVAYHSYFAYGRGIVQLSIAGEAESYLAEEQITHEQGKAHIMDYDPLTIVLVQYPGSQGTIFGAFLTEPSPEVASMIHKAQRTRKEAVYHGKNSTRLIRMAEIKFYESILQIALEITQSLHNIITAPYRRDVLQLAIRLIGQSQTLFHLGSPLVSLVPVLGSQKSVVDISSISSIVRTLIETYLTMHEVFFEPKNDNDFDFFHSRWMLVGLHSIKKHTPDPIYKVYATEEVEPLRVDATKRMENTTQYRAMFSQKKNDPKKTMEALLRRYRDRDEWERIAQSANIDASAYQKMYSAYSGYIHSDGYTSYKLNHHDPSEFDINVEMMLFVAARLLSKMIFDFAQVYQKAEQIAKSKHIYPVIEWHARYVNEDQFLKLHSDKFVRP